MRDDPVIGRWGSVPCSRGGSDDAGPTSGFRWSWAALLLVSWIGVLALARPGTAQSADQSATRAATQETRSESASRSAGPVGIWNLEMRNLAQRATGGVRNTLLRIEEEDGELRAQMTAPSSDFLDVQTFRFEDGEMLVRFGSYEYSLQMDGDRLSGTMTSPVVTLQVTGTKQESVMYAGDEPEVYVTTRSGILGHRDELAPPDEEADPAGWVKRHADSAGDLALIVRGTPVPFTNWREFENELMGFAGRRISVTGVWEGDRFRIREIGLAEEG